MKNYFFHFIVLLIIIIFPVFLLIWQRFFISKVWRKSWKENQSNEIVTICLAANDNLTTSRSAPICWPSILDSSRHLSNSIRQVVSIVLRRASLQPLLNKESTSSSPCPLREDHARIRRDLIGLQWYLLNLSTSSAIYRKITCK